MRNRFYFFLQTRRRHLQRRPGGDRPRPPRQRPPLRPAGLGVGLLRLGGNGVRMVRGLGGIRTQLARGAPMHI